MELVIGLLIIAIGAFCQSSSYVPINKIKDWSWESYWIIQGIFAWLLFPLIGSLLSVSGTGGSFGDLLTLINSDPKAAWLTILFGVLWGVGGLRPLDAVSGSRPRAINRPWNLLRVRRHSRTSVHGTCQ